MFSGAMAGRRRAAPRPAVEEGGDAPRSKGKNLRRRRRSSLFVVSYKLHLILSQAMHREGTHFGREYLQIIMSTTLKDFGGLVPWSQSGG
jgi:hypothetical protein